MPGRGGDVVIVLLRDSQVWSILLTFTDFYGAAHTAGGTLAGIRHWLNWRWPPSFEIAMPLSEYTMNIFYIIGVIVVVLFVAGYFGLHA